MNIYEDIEEGIGQQQSLLELISQLHSISVPSRRLRTASLSHHQIISQIYEHLKNPLEKLKTQIEATWQLDPNEQMQEEQPQQQPLDEQDQNEEEAEFDEGDEEGMEEQEGEQMEQEYVEQGDEEREEGKGVDPQYRVDFEDEDVPVSDDDIGLYGEQLDEEEMESYENEEMEDDPQFGNEKLGQYRAEHAEKNENEDDHEEDFINENFEQFREIEINKQEVLKEGKNELDAQIDRLEANAMSKRDWALSGEVKSRERPLNSLLETDLNFKSGLKYTHQIDEQYNHNLEEIIKKRILDEMYDDRTRLIVSGRLGESLTGEPISTEKSEKGLAELYELEFKNHLGLGNNKDDKLKKEIMGSLKEINYLLDSLSNLSFTFKPASYKKAGGADAIVAEEKVPLTQWDGTLQASGRGRPTLESEKEVDKKGKRLKNKRIARQRKKEQDKKKMNRVIEYGGMTKQEAEARKKIAKTKAAATGKFNKSNNFFSKLNNKDAKPGKPNPNLSKLKI